MSSLSIELVLNVHYTCYWLNEATYLWDRGHATRTLRVLLVISKCVYTFLQLHAWNRAKNSCKLVQQ